MINLAAEVLVPFKTQGKTRRGKMALYVGPHNHHTSKHRWIAKDPITSRLPGDSFFTADNGLYMQNGAEYDDDIVAISRKWTPAIGDMVTVCGIAKKVGLSTGHFNFNTGHDRADACHVTGVAPDSGVGELYRISWGGTEYDIHRDNLRRVAT